MQANIMAFGSVLFKVDTSQKSQTLISAIAPNKIATYLVSKELPTFME
ncbi:MAG: hypothetical protein WA919_25000 [Coleofasciculaceae cyanobacterium]